MSKKEAIELLRKSLKDLNYKIKYGNLVRSRREELEKLYDAFNYLLDNAIYSDFKDTFSQLEREILNIERNDSQVKIFHIVLRTRSGKASSPAYIDLNPFKDE